MVSERILCLLIGVVAIYVVEVQSAKGPLVNLGHQLGYYQGDIQIPAGKTRNAILKTRRWTDGIVYYDLGNQWDKDQLAMIKEAMSAVEKSTCIRFKIRTNEVNYVMIRNTKGGCFSTGAGMQGGLQQISLQDDENASCFSHGIIVHEFLHCIGLWHEQCRHDRDDFIKIHWENLANTTTMRWQFRKIPESESSTYGIPYNYLSIMHYDAYSGAIGGGVTMEPKDKAYLYEIGNQGYAHEWDWEKIRRLYECKGSFTPVPTTPRPCVDTYSECATYLNKCGVEGWTVSMCRKSCGFCRGGTGPVTQKPNAPVPTTKAPAKPPQKCEDEINYCKDYMSSCGKESWMAKACRKSCGMC